MTGALDMGGAGIATLHVRDGDGATKQISLLIDGVTCAGCIARVEGAANAVPGVEAARLNFSTKRMRVEWRGPAATAERIVAAIGECGYTATPFSADGALDGDAAALRGLMRALGVAGFAAMNVMLLSVSLWAGVDMEASTQALFHWLSALIVLPALAYAGQPFYRGALTALRSGRLNMDVPISLAVILAAAMSLYQTVAGRDEIYFDASIMLLFFLLLGRVLDLRVRAKARSAAQGLLALRARAATVIGADGTHRLVKPEALAPGMRVAVASGETVPADGVLESSRASLDMSLLSGEALPETVSRGADVFAGSLNLGDPVEIAVTVRDENSLLAEIVRLMETAEQGRARYVRLADRLATFYAPAVHVLAATTFAIWLVMGAGWEVALVYAIAVLIVTCPCALGLAVPAVQVVAGGRLLNTGVLVKSGDALERLAEIDTVVFDKTGTLTTGALTLADAHRVDAAALALAAGLARESRHPLSRALTRAAGPHVAVVSNIHESPGAGLSGETAAGPVRLGSRDWVGAQTAPDDTLAELWLRDAGGKLTRFGFTDQPRADARDTVAALKRMGVAVMLLSGDRVEPVRETAAALGIGDWRARCQPQHKVALLGTLAAEGRKVLMVGDGLNDAPALAAAHVSMSPSGASDVAQTAADFIALGDRLGAVSDSLTVARACRRLIFQNFALALGYNMFAVPLAMLGLVTPLIAAIAMSASSIVVTLNAIRLKWIS